MKLSKTTKINHEVHLDTYIFIFVKSKFKIVKKKLNELRFLELVPIIVLHLLVT